MKKAKFLLRSLILLPLSATFLVGCDASSDGGATKNNVFTVNYFDDSPTPKQVGYAYVAEGGRAVMRKMNDSEAYDFLSHSGNKASFGKRIHFENWKGSYDGSYTNKDGEVITGEVDLKNIKADCNVYANFEEIPLTYRVSYKNGSSTLVDHNTETFNWGSFASLPIDQSTTPVWGYDKSFKGFVFNKDDTFPLTSLNFANAKFLHGEGEPNTATLKDESEAIVATPTPGSFYEDMNTMDFYGYSGSWTLLANFETSSNPRVTYLSSFNDELLQFRVTFYTDSSKADEIGSLELDYATSVSFNNTTKTITGINHGNPVSLNFTSLIGNVQYWDGSYSSDESVPERYRGQNISNKQTSNQSIPVAAPLSLYPIFY